MEPAPLFDDLADVPKGGAAWWLHAADGVRLRLAHWPAGPRGTVLIFPGRTEPIEKYGRAASALAERGYGCFVVDWRGQGLSDRLTDDPLMGHVNNFADYQHDVVAVMDAVHKVHGDAPLPLLCHSMGGCIGLRALSNGLKAPAVAFSAPMWGIALTPAMQRGVRMLSFAGRLTGMDERYVPASGREFNLSEMDFDDNILTTDRGSFDWMQAQVRTRPELAIGAPSLRWLGEALAECRALERLSSPDLPACCGLGSREKVVDPDAVAARMARWPGGVLETYEGAEHELMMEAPQHRTRFFDRVAAFFTERAKPAH